MLMGEFLTAVHHRLPVKVVIYNNSAFGLIRWRPSPSVCPLSRRASNSPIRILPPSPALAAAMASRPEARRAEGRDRRGVRVDGPAIVDAVVAADEMPNLPHLDLETVGHFAVAKIKEAVLTVTGS